MSSPRSVAFEASFRDAKHIPELHAPTVALSADNRMLARKPMTPFPVDAADRDTDDGRDAFWTLNPATAIMSPSTSNSSDSHLNCYLSNTSSGFQMEHNASMDALNVFSNRSNCHATPSPSSTTPPIAWACAQRLLSHDVRTSVSDMLIHNMAKDEMVCVYDDYEEDDLECDDEVDESADIGSSSCVLQPKFYAQYEKVGETTKHLVKGYLCALAGGQPDADVAQVLSVLSVLTANYVHHIGGVHFDRRAEHLMVDGATAVTVASSTGFSEGRHSWSLRILECDVHRHEIGVLENVHKIDRVTVKSGGAGEAPGFGARAFYGSHLFSHENYYASYNKDGFVRCRKDLCQKIGWCTGDVIRTDIDLKKGCIRWFLNGKKVRKTISIQKGCIYYPFICFAGNFQYEVVAQ